MSKIELSNKVDTELIVFLKVVSGTFCHKKGVLILTMNIVDC